MEGRQFFVRADAWFLGAIALGLFTVPVQPVTGCEESARPATSTVELMQLVQIKAALRLADGSPVIGAVVVTSMGGQAVSDERGRVQVELRLPLHVDEVHLNAIATSDHARYQGQLRVPIVHEGGAIDAGDITLQAITECDPQWLPMFGSNPDVNHTVLALTVYDDGSGGGPALYAGGSFTTAGGVVANRVAKWDGTSWSALGSGMNNTVAALAVFDDGSGNGPALYAAGDFTIAGGVSAHRVAKWDGTTWSALGSGVNNSALALAVHDDGNGYALFAGGHFTQADGSSASRIAKWDGSAWSQLGVGTSGPVRALQVFDDGSGNGPALYAGGFFATAGDVNVANLAQWDGSAWSSVGGGVSGEVRAMSVFDDGSAHGESLYVGGTFSTAGGVSALHIARWNGTLWSALAGGISQEVSSMIVYDDGLGAALHATGVSSINRWDGLSWSQLPQGSNSHVRAFEVFDDGSGNALYVGSIHVTGPNPSHRIVRWDGHEWSLLGTGIDNGIQDVVVFDEGSGPALFVGGGFRIGSGVTLDRVAKWDGASWQPLGVGMNDLVRSLEVFDDGSGPALYAAGHFTTAGGKPANRIARWDGLTWSSVGDGLNGNAFDLAVHDDGSGEGYALYAGGQFTMAGTTLANRIAKWDGLTWSPVGEGMNNRVHVLTSFPAMSGSRSSLFAGGQFTAAGGSPANRIAKWDGNNWLPLGSGLNDAVHAIVAFDDGSGEALYAGGFFTSAGGVTANRIAKWDGSSWSPLGSGLSNVVWTLHVHDDGEGDGPSLFAGGAFTTAGGEPANYIAKWNESKWYSLNSGLNSAVTSFATFDDGLGSALYIGGGFAVSATGDSYITKWACLAVHMAHFSVRPDSCPSPLNPNANGVLPAAIFGDTDLDATSIDPTTIALARADRIGASVAPLLGPPGPGIEIEDVGTPFVGNHSCDCQIIGKDGIDDLSLKFSVPDVVETLELDTLPSGATVELKITGQLLDGTPFSGADCITIVGQGNQPSGPGPDSGSKSSVVGDQDGDGTIGISDQLFVLAHWGQCGDCGECPADLNADCSVGVADLLILLANWG